MKIKIKNRTAILLVIAALILITGLTFSVFTYQANKKGVISTDAIDTYFSSNYLNLCSNETIGTDGVIDHDKYEGQTLLFSESGESDTISFEFTVQNYLTAGTIAHNSQTIDYNLTLVLEGTEYGTLTSYQLTDITSGNTSPITPFNDNQKVWTSSSAYSLQGGYDSLHTFRVTIPRDALNKVQLLVVAQPDANSLLATNNKMLARIFSPCTESNIKEFSCTSQFTDRLIDSNVMPYDLDAFNYEISINTGSAWITLTWNTDYVTIDPFFKNRVTIDSTKTTSNTIVFKMDTAVVSSNYIQFYRKAGKDSTQNWQANWDTMGTIITSSAEQIISE